MIRARAMRAWHSKVNYNLLAMYLFLHAHLRSTLTFHLTGFLPSPELSD